MAWEVYLHKRVLKQVARLPEEVKKRLFALLTDIREYGPVKGKWPHYGKLGKGRHHCHLKKGHPTYVAIWEERDNQIKLVEVTYVGTHERAPY
jgi:mRNA-degrading endonuclease RelE of RelBE toxin-antitoxin system